MNARQEDRLNEINTETRNYLISKFSDLNLGDTEGLDAIPLDELEKMIDELGIAQRLGFLNLETDRGVDTLKSIVDRYI